MFLLLLRSTGETVFRRGTRITLPGGHMITLGTNVTKIRVFLVVEAPGAGSFTSREKEALSTGRVGRKKHLAPAG